MKILRVKIDDTRLTLRSGNWVRYAFDLASLDMSSRVFLLQEALNTTATLAHVSGEYQR